jgi:hypothetical protein
VSGARYPVGADGASRYNMLEVLLTETGDAGGDGRSQCRHEQDPQSDLRAEPCCACGADWVLMLLMCSAGNDGEDQGSVASRSPPRLPGRRRAGRRARGRVSS